MVEIIQNFERAAGRFDTGVLADLGLVCVLIGLFVWLGGLGFRKLLLVLVGLLVGGICGFLLTGRNAVLALISAAAGAIAATALERVFIVIIASGLSVVVGIVILSAPYSQRTVNSPLYYGYENELENGVFNAEQSLEITKMYIADLASSLKRACSQMPGYNWVIVAALGGIVILGGFYAERLTSALCCSVLGTVLIFSGMILLLLYKGTTVISYIFERPLFYAGVSLAMISFGTIEQLVLCKVPGHKVTSKKQQANLEEADEAKQTNWRTK